jgi:CheY-like chemotaxis protein/DNA-directed RNA polymerase specialized sigma24 family protein
MSEMAREVASEVPFMRRYARAILGSQKEGDAFVRAALESLLRDTSELDMADIKVALFRALNRLFTQPERAGGKAPASTMAPHSILESRLEGLYPIGRRLLLLTTLEGFTLAKAACVLDLDPEEATRILQDAKQELRRQRPTRILIIEDEPVIALDIATAISRNGHTVVGIATTHKEAVALARTGEPGLILADIQLADDSSGLEAVQEILTLTSVPVIFVTAYPERLLTGERPEPTFLITKPFDHDTLDVSIAQALAAGLQDSP